MMGKEFTVLSEKGKTRKGKMRATPTGFMVTGGNYKAEDLAVYAKRDKPS